MLFAWISYIINISKHILFWLTFDNKVLFIAAQVANRVFVTWNTPVFNSSRLDQANSKQH